MGIVDDAYAYALARVNEAVEEIGGNPNRAEWTDAELADGLTISYQAHPIAEAMPGLFAVAAIELANARAEVERLRAELDRYRPAVMGIFCAYQHDCGLIDEMSDGQIELMNAEGGGCDACEVSDADASGWHLLYRREAKP